MSYLEFCAGCRAPVTVRWPRSVVGCAADGRSCARPAQLTADQVLARQAQLQLEHELMWAALGINIAAGAGELLEENGSAQGSAR